MEEVTLLRVVEESVGGYCDYDSDDEAFELPHVDV